MVLLCLEGELGSGKTLGLTYLAALNYNKGRTIYSNYELRFPYTYVDTIEMISEMENCFAALDEFWLWADSRASHSKKNKIISTVLLQSRHIDCDIGFTAQSFHQIDRRIRHVTDFIIRPMLNKSETKCTLFWYSKASAKPAKIMRFSTGNVFPLYKSTGRDSIISQLKDDPDKKKQDKNLKRSVKLQDHS